MAYYVAEQYGTFDEATNTWTFQGYNIKWRIGDADCPYTDHLAVPMFYSVLSADFDEPVSAVFWNASGGLQLKPIDEREYPLTKVPYYASLMSYLTSENKVLTELLKAIIHQYPIQPHKDCYHAIEDALNEATTPQPPSG